MTVGMTVESDSSYDSESRMKRQEQPFIVQADFLNIMAMHKMTTAASHTAVSIIITHLQVSMHVMMMTMAVLFKSRFPVFGGGI